MPKTPNNQGDDLEIVQTLFFRYSFLFDAVRILISGTGTDAAYTQPVGNLFLPKIIPEHMEQDSKVLTDVIRILLPLMPFVAR